MTRLLTSALLAAALAAAAEARIEQRPLDRAFLREHCGRVLSGMDRVCDWVKRL